MDAKVALAGPIAQQRAHPGSSRGDVADVANARNAALCMTLLLRGEPLPRPGTRVEVKVDSAVVDAAEATLKRLRHETEALLIEHWPAVDRVAQCLLNRNLLDQAELDRLIDNSRQSSLSTQCS
jgi:hypothetical protein